MSAELSSPNSSRSTEDTSQPIQNAILFLQDGQLRAPGALSTAVLGPLAEQLVDVAPERLPGPLGELLNRAASSPGEHVLPALELAPPGGSSRWFRVQFSRPASAGPAVLVFSPLNATRGFDQNLRRLESLAGLGALAASLAHEIRNSMVAVRTFVDLLLEKSHDPDTTVVVGRELRRADALLAQMLRLSATGKPAMAPTRVHVALEHCLRLIRPQLATQRIELDRKFHAASDQVSGNEYELQQAFMNLILNAADAIGSDGTIRVTTEVVEGRLRVVISDTGPGIAAEDLPRLFDAFFTTKEDGTGLGLAITRRIVREHNGSITAQSEPGRGAEFDLRFPLLAEV